MPNPIQVKLADESEEDDTYALNALKDLDDFASDTGIDIGKINISSGEQKVVRDNSAKISENTVSARQKSYCKTKTIENNSDRNVKTNSSTYSGVSTPPMDSVPDLRSHNKIAQIKTNDSGTDVSYSPDFTDDTELTNDEMTAWEKWFVMKQGQIRLRAETEKKKKLIEEQKVQELRKKKAADNERLQKQWLEKKKMEDIARKEKDKEMNAKDNKGTASEFGFDNWYQKKIQEKKNQLRFTKEQQKYEELQKEIRKKKNQKAQMEWMNKAKQRPITPRVTYAYVGDSVIGFYDSTSHPPPTYINPTPWQP